MSQTRTDCRNRRSHADGLALVDYLLAHGGKVAKSNEAIAHDLGFIRNHGGGNYSVDTQRFRSAVNHVKDGVLNGSPCCVYRLHYRTTVSGAEFVLIDPNGGLGYHADATLETVRGWAVREAAHHTENQRQVETFEVLADHALAQGDKFGQRLCIKAAMEIDSVGTVSAVTMGELVVWMNSL